MFFACLSELWALLPGARAATTCGGPLVRPYSCLTAHDNFPSCFENTQALLASMILAVDPKCWTLGAFLYIQTCTLGKAAMRLPTIADRRQKGRNGFWILDIFETVWGLIFVREEPARSRRRLHLCDFEFKHSFQARIAHWPVTGI